eukprot:CAMPEP_0116922708 /NCGR_PEP_ID=MMETSP0467-20121206/22423_1 /TAXON_ID=283647 /ORGANISM="Mesodinium pulex, Strain SPMC105" /LENGTH=197 /DNA_ID=CAMNT_0004601091 /DNA_START=29 /DNA_END=622 /DNA_ORIENTATION=+
MAAARKIVKPRAQEPTEFEMKVAQELYNLQNSPSVSFKNDLKLLHITAAQEVDVDGGKKAIIMFVPYPLLKEFRRIQKPLVEELEKKFSGHHVVIVAQRTILKKSYARNRKFSGPRPRSRTLKVVQEAVLEDLVYPTEIIGKRTRVRMDGSKLMKVHLNPKGQLNVETKLETFATVYKRLTNKEVTFEFPVQKKLKE